MIIVLLMVNQNQSAQGFDWRELAQDCTVHRHTETKYLQHVTEVKPNLKQLFWLFNKGEIYLPTDPKQIIYQIFVFCFYLKHKEKSLSTITFRLTVCLQLQLKNRKSNQFRYGAKIYIFRVKKLIRSLLYHIQNYRL